MTNPDTLDELCKATALWLAKNDTLPLDTLRRILRESLTDMSYPPETQTIIWTRACRTYMELPA